MSVVADPVVPAPFRWSDGHLALDLEHGHVRFTTRRGGVSGGRYATLNLGPWTDDDPADIAENRRRLAALAGGRRLLQGHQVHGTTVAVGGGRGEDADGQATADPGSAPVALAADCLPVALVAPGAVAVAHAGWPGLAGGILARAVAAVRGLAGDEAPVAAALGPAAGPCCYEVGDDLRTRFGTTGRTLDLPAIAAGQLHAAGVGEVHRSGLCTMCAPEGLFFSHRRDGGATGRQAGIAWRR
jgi:polyphenol oxidase